MNELSYKQDTIIHPISHDVRDSISLLSDFTLFQRRILNYNVGFLNVFLILFQRMNAE